ncbi:MAG: YebC/PmpR family DNA-binding transcriptional regulator, partial [Actinomycetota bacterium]|nr:YebC/PmpR family DNA-binding transcriptional regulator [Actinomycetota bacterium]
MSGHSKWASIKHKKKAVDAKRGALFTKLTRAITVAAREGGGDPEGNPTLALAIQKARDASMPKDNIERAIAKGTGADSDADAFESVLYEGYGPSGVAILVEALTDNRNRTASEVRTAFGRHGGTLGETGSVAFMFERVGLVHYPAPAASTEEMFEAALDAGADDVQSGEPGHDVYCAADDLSQVRDTLEQRFGPADAARLDWRPRNAVPIGEAEAEILFKLLDALDDNE